MLRLVAQCHSQCEPGSTDDDDDLTTPCVECSAGFYAGTGHVGVCDSCPAGKYADAASTECTECAAEGLVDDDEDPSTPCSAAAPMNCGTDGWEYNGYCWYYESDTDEELSCDEVCQRQGAECVVEGRVEEASNLDCTVCRHWFPGLPCDFGMHDEEAKPCTYGGFGTEQKCEYADYSPVPAECSGHSQGSSTSRFCSCTEPRLRDAVCQPGTTRRFISPNANDGTARRGPSVEDLRAAYANQPLRGEVTEGDHRGYQQWTVPYSGSYRIVAAGAQGGGLANVNSAASNGFAGAKIEGTFELRANQVLTIVVGTAGGTANGGHGDASSSSNGGGGGSFVMQEDGQPLLIAGGGAGAWSTQYAGNCDVSPLSSGRGQGQAGEDTEPLVCGGISATGGYDGGGGAAVSISGLGGSAGGGFLSPGDNGGAQETQSTGGGSFRSGLVGGDDGNDANNEDADGGWGGFGGGGGACLSSPGAGGGYSGGPSAGHWSSAGGAGGGGSFNAGADPVNTAGGGDEAAARPSADGYVLISC